MQFDFESIIDRRGKDAIALDVRAALKNGLPGIVSEGPGEGYSIIPMWVADMNFPTVPSVPEAIIERTKHPAYGYFQPRKEYYEAIIRWQRDRNGVEGLSAAHIGYENGVLGGVISALNALCSRGDKVLIHAPTYIGFTRSLRDNGYELVHSFLQKDAQGVWRMDYEDMEEKLRSQHIHAAILCSPHNPSGRVWEREELERAMALFKKYEVYVISDEIWSDLTLDGHRHIPTQQVSEDARMRTVALYAPSKTFNLAGLIGSYHIIYNSWLRDRVSREGDNTHYNHMNVLSMYALLGAYTEQGAAWVDELRTVLSRNVHYACDFIRKNFEGVEVSQPEGTYMIFLDCQRWCELHHRSMDELEAAGVAAGVLWQDGRAFNGPYAIRMNLALPHSLVVEAFERLKAQVF